MRNRSRPVLHIPRTSLETLLEVLTALAIITALAMTVWGYFALPAIIPTHFDASGVPNAYGGKESLLILPIISICLAVSLTFLSRYPHIYNYPSLAEETSLSSIIRLCVREYLYESSTHAHTEQH